MSASVESFEAGGPMGDGLTDIAGRRLLILQLRLAQGGSGRARENWLCSRGGLTGGGAGARGAGGEGLTGGGAGGGGAGGGDGGSGGDGSEYHVVVF